MYRKKQIISGATFKEVWDRAMKILEFRDHSVAELTFKLEQRFDDEAVIKQTIKECLKHKYLDDDRFTEHFVEWLKRKGKSLFAIKQELRNRGVEDSIIAKYLKDVSDTDTALLLAKQRMRGIVSYPKEEQKKKLGTFLSNRGFSYDIIQRVFTHYHLNG